MTDHSERLFGREPELTHDRVVLYDVDNAGAYGEGVLEIQALVRYTRFDDDTYGVKNIVLHNVEVDGIGADLWKIRQALMVELETKQESYHYKLMDELEGIEI